MPSTASVSSTVAGQSQGSNITRANMLKNFQKDNYGDIADLEIPISEIDQNYIGGKTLESDSITGKGWGEVEIDGQKGYTNGHIMLVADAPFGKRNISHSKEKPDASKILERFKKAETINPVKASARTHTVVIEFENGAIVDFQYYNLIKANYPDATFKGTNDPNNTLLIYDGKNVIGAVQPLEVKKKPDTPLRQAAETRQTDTFEALRNDFNTAVENNDRLNAQRALNALLQVKEVDHSFDRGGAHGEPDPEGGAPLWDVSRKGQVYPEDVYSLEGRRYYGTGEDAMDATAWSLIQAYKGRPNKPITIYRAIEKNSLAKGIQPGEWVTPIRRYAVEHGQSALNGKYRIQQKTVYARDIYTAGDSWLEWGYHPQERMAEAFPPKKNGERRKLDERVDLQAKLAESRRAFAPADDSILRQAAQDHFYSQLERTIEQKMPAKASADQIRGIIKDTKKEERDWLGIDQWLDEHPNPTKQEVLDFVRGNNVKVEEVVKGKDAKNDISLDNVRRVIDEQGEYVASNGTVIMAEKDGTFSVNTDYNDEFTPQMKAIREQPLFKAADAEAKDLIDRLATAHTEDVVDNTSIKIHDDGTGEISEGAQELIRRTLGTLTKKGLIKDSGQSFYGVTMSKNHLSLASRELKTYAVKLEKLGYKPEQVQSVKDLSDALKTLADKSDYNSLWVFEESKAHETVHREEKNAGGIDDIAEKRLSKSPFLKSKKFQKVNGHLSVKDQISEVAASLINNEDMGWDVPDFETHKKAFLNTWSDGIFRQAGLDTKNTSAENQKLLDEFIAKYPTIGKTYEDTKADTTGNETSESESVSPTESSGKGADNAETQGSGERVGVGEAAYTPSGKETLSKTPKTLRKHGIDVADKPYIAATNAGQQKFATNLLDKGISKAHEWFNLQIEHGNGNNGGTTAVGLNLMKSYGMNGNLKAMNEVADELVPYLKESGQAIQAMAILNIFDPANASTYAAKYVKQKTGKDLTQDQKAKAESIAKNMSEAVRVDAMTIALEKDFERQLAEIKAERDSYKEQADQVELDLAEAKKEIAKLKERPTRTPNVKKLIAELEAKSNETDAIIARAFAPSDIQRMAASESPKLNPNVKNALVDWATRELYKDLDKGVTVGEFYNKISKKANGALSNEDVFDIHAQAANRLIEPHTTTLKRLTERARTDTPPTAEEWQKAFDANAKSLNRKEHLKIAKKIVKSNTDEFAKKLSKVPDKMTSAIIRDGVEQGFSDEAIFHALARRSMSQRDAEVLLQKEYPNVNPRRVMVEANNLIAKAKQTVRDNRIQAENDYKLAEDDLKAIQEERRVNDAVKRRIKKDADNFYSSLSKSNLQTGVEGAISFRKANLLTGIKTHAVNMVSNTTFAGAEEILTRQLATLADIGASKITGQRTVQGLSPTGIVEGFKALVKSDATLKNANEPTGIEKAWSILRHGDSMEEQHKLQYLESHIREKFAPGTAGITQVRLLMLT
jgi:hypothetical protein